MKYAFIFLLFAILVAPNSAACQCKYEENGFDKFEKVEKVLTKEVKVLYPTIKFPTVWLSLGRIDTAYFVKIKFYQDKALCFGSDSELLILADSNEVFRLKKNGGLDCTTTFNAGITTVQQGVLIYEISKADLQALSGKTLQMIRIYASGDNIEADIATKNVNKKKGMAFFKNNVACVLKK